MLVSSSVWPVLSSPNCLRLWSAVHTALLYPLLVGSVGGILSQLITLVRHGGWCWRWKFTLFLMPKRKKIHALTNQTARCPAPPPFPPVSTYSALLCSQRQQRAAHSFLLRNTFIKFQPSPRHDRVIESKPHNPESQNGKNSAYPRRASRVQARRRRTVCASPPLPRISRNRETDF